MYGTHAMEEKRYSPSICKLRAQNNQRESRSRTHKHFLCRASESFDANGNPSIYRLTNAFSKKLENHIHALSIYFMHYNFVRIHQTIRCSAAMEAGVTDRLWSLEDLVQ